jgi:hypothetical protein
LRRVLSARFEPWLHAATQSKRRAAERVLVRVNKAVFMVKFKMFELIIPSNVKSHWKLKIFFLVLSFGFRVSGLMERACLPKEGPCDCRQG